MLKKKESSKIQYQVLTALVLPVYNEYSNLPRLIESLLHNASNSTAIIVVDDSEPKVLSDGYKKNFKIHTETFFVLPCWRKFFVILHIAEFKYMYFFCK